MCLINLRKIKNVDYAWKAFEFLDGRLYPFYMNKAIAAKNSRKCYPIEEWFKDRRKLSLHCWGKKNLKYPAGFHFYYRKKDAIEDIKDRGKGVVRKVRLRNIVATGEQFLGLCGVAKEIFIERM